MVPSNFNELCPIVNIPVTRASPLTTSSVLAPPTTTLPIVVIPVTFKLLKNEVPVVSIPAILPPPPPPETVANSNFSVVLLYFKNLPLSSDPFHVTSVSYTHLTLPTKRIV